MSNYRCEVPRDSEFFKVPTYILLKMGNIYLPVYTCHHGVPCNSGNDEGRMRVVCILQAAGWLSYQQIKAQLSLETFSAAHPQ